MINFSSIPDAKSLQKGVQISLLYSVFLEMTSSVKCSLCCSPQSCVTEIRLMPISVPQLVFTVEYDIFLFGL